MILFRYIEYILFRLSFYKTTICTRSVFTSAQYSLLPTANLLQLFPFPRLSSCDCYFISQVFVVRFILPTCFQYTSLQLWFCYFIVQVLNLSNYLQFLNITSLYVTYLSIFGIRVTYFSASTIISIFTIDLPPVLSNFYIAYERPKSTTPACTILLGCGKNT